MLVSDPWFYAVAIPAILMVGISKGGLGGGLGLIGTPMIALVVSPVRAAAILLPILCLMDLFGLRAYRGQWSHRNMRILLPAATIGIMVGTLTFRHLDENWIRLLIGALALGFSLRYWLASAVDQAAVPPNLLRGSLWGSISGFTSFVAHAGGPPLSVYLLPQRLDKTVFVGTTVVFYFAVNYIKLLPYSWLGQLSSENLATSALLSPLAPLGMWLGIRLHRHIPQEPFYQVCYALLIVAGLKLIYDGVGGLLGAP